MSPDLPEDDPFRAEDPRAAEREARRREREAKRRTRSGGARRSLGERVSGALGGVPGRARVTHLVSGCPVAEPPPEPAPAEPPKPRDPEDSARPGGDPSPAGDDWFATPETDKWNPDSDEWAAATGVETPADEPPPIRRDPPDLPETGEDPLPGRGGSGYTDDIPAIPSEPEPEPEPEPPAVPPTREAFAPSPSVLPGENDESEAIRGIEDRPHPRRRGRDGGSGGGRHTFGFPSLGGDSSDGRSLWIRRLIALGLLLLALGAIALVAKAVLGGGDDPAPVQKGPKTLKTVSVTIPEGLTISQMADVAKKAKLKGDYEKAVERPTRSST